MNQNDLVIFYTLLTMHIHEADLSAVALEELYSSLSLILPEDLMSDLKRAVHLISDMPQQVH